MLVFVTIAAAVEKRRTAAIAARADRTSTKRGCLSPKKARGSTTKGKGRRCTKVKAPANQLSSGFMRLAMAALHNSSVLRSSSSSHSGSLASC